MQVNKIISNNLNNHINNEHTFSNPAGKKKKSKLKKSKTGILKNSINLNKYIIKYTCAVI